MRSPILDIKGLTHLFEEKKNGIQDISFQVFKDDFLLLAGVNGSGKTTLIRHLNGLIRPDSGQVLLNGKNILKDLTGTRKKVGMVFQDPETQFIGDTVYEEVAFGLENLGTPRDEINTKVTRAIEQLNLGHLKDRNPSTLSGGEKRRLAIADILVMEPEVIIFDEPFSNLDYPSTKALAELVIQLNQAGHIIIMATHDVEPVIRHATRILIMESGQLVENDSPEKLVRKLESYGVKEPREYTAGLAQDGCAS